MGVLWIGADWPVHDLAEGYLYRMHMTQHLLFTLVAAPLLIAGMPAWMLRSLLSPRLVQRVFRFFTRPLVALVLFNGVLLFTHWPGGRRGIGQIRADPPGAARADRDVGARDVVAGDVAAAGDAVAAPRPGR